MRYSLIDFEGNIIYRGTLSAVDKYTTIDTKKLEENLEKIGIKINDLIISYRVDYQEKTLKVLEKKYSYLNELRRTNDTIDITDGRFRNIVLRIYNKVNGNKELLEAIRCSKCVNDMVVEKLDKLNEKYDEFNFDRLLEHLKQYKQLRQLVMFVEEYNGEKNKTLEQKPSRPIVHIVRNKITTIDEIEDDKDPDDYMYDNWEKERAR